MAVERLNDVFLRVCISSLPYTAADWSRAVLAAWHILQLSCQTLNVDGTITAEKKKKVINVFYKGNISCFSNADFSFTCLFL